MKIEVPFQEAVNFLVNKGFADDGAKALLNHISKSKGDDYVIQESDYKGWEDHYDINNAYYYEFGGYPSVNDVVCYINENAEENGYNTASCIATEFENEMFNFMEYRLRKFGQLIKTDDGGYLYKQDPAN